MNEVLGFMRLHKMQQYRTNRLCMKMKQTSDEVRFTSQHEIAQYMVIHLHKGQKISKFHKES